MAKKSTEYTIEEKLTGLYELQRIDSKIDKIRIVRGELPLEVKDLEDEIEGLDTRLTKLQDENTELETSISDRKNMIKEAKAAIKKYSEQQKNVRNNREYDSISKEIEFQELEIQLSDKKILEGKAKIEHKAGVLTSSKEKLEERKKDLELKEDPRLVDIEQYKYSLDQESLNEKNKVAIVYVQGMIHLGESQEKTTGSDTYCRILKQIREDKDILGVILRIQSPGGGALALASPVHTSFGLGSAA